MSDYFAALMRASGLGQAPGTTASSGTELSVLDLEIPAVAAPLGHAPHALAARTETLPPAVPTATVQTAAPVIPPAPDRPQFVDTPVNALATPTLPVAEPTTAQTVPVSSEPLVAHQALVQSVMRWVAGDKSAPPTATVQQVPSTSATPAVPGERPLTQPSPPTARSLATATLSNVETVEAAPLTHQPLPAEPAPFAQTARHPSSLQQQAAAVVREQPEPEQSQPAPADGLSISIGAIHLRVEAPAAPSAPQAAAKPAVQPAAPRSTTSPSTATARSSLSRRALRRI